MFCNKCGNEVKEGEKFCNKCGEKIEETVGSITFFRQNSFYGCLVGIKIYMDGNLVATVANGNGVVVPATIGTHKFAFNLWSGNKITDIEVTKEHPNIKVVFKLGMGLLTAKPKILEIVNL
ncbi:MAG: zinc ribbon domain-containing protein [Clostridia bacterium]|jgi:hypothetical protein|nr:zinc ribbon domain-containing protein [Clostridia bacterium]